MRKFLGLGFIFALAVAATLLLVKSPTMTGAQSVAQGAPGIAPEQLLRQVDTRTILEQPAADMH